ncbi:MAG: MFS transporter [Thermoguttaceae bacterium]
MESTHPPFVRTRLSIMMFLEFFVWGSWGFAITGYALNTLKFDGSQVGWLGAIPAIGAIVSPLFVGMIADKYFPAQRVLGVLHLAGGACLIAAGFQTSFWPLITLMMINGLFFMPSIALVNSVAFTHIPDADKFPRIAVFGTLGWIAAVVIASVALGGASTPNFLYLAGVGAIVLALYCQTLPNTPPKGAESGGDAFGLGALKLMKDPSFLIFIVCVFLFSIPACGFFFTLAVPMLQQRGYPSPLALTTLNQLAELVFMFTMPLFVVKLGLKRVLLIGMAAWAIRYLCFACPEFSMAIVGLLLHGFCYSFFYVGAYMYVDKKAPEDMKASAQSLLSFLLLGVGWLVGGLLAGNLMEAYKPEVSAMAAIYVEKAQPVTDAKLPRWDDPDAATSAWRYLDLSATVGNLISPKGEAEEEPAAKDLAQQLDTDEDRVITTAEIKAFPHELIDVDGYLYSQEDLIAVFKQIAALEKAEGDETADDAVSLTQDQWLKAQSCDWGPIWLYPSIFLFVILGLFAVAFRDKPTKEEGAEG